MKSIAVFCGSSKGVDPEYALQARLLGETLAQRDIMVVYGGARLGLMGELADATLAAGGKVTGVMPHFLERKEIAHLGLTELILTDSMHQRKKRINDISDGFVALPGGFGTLDESFEMITWAQLGIHHKPIAFLNINGFYNPLIAMVNNMVEKGFLKPTHRDMLIVSDDILDMLTTMDNYAPPHTGKWIS
jgi:uncharacterized protein (TIGR00730 family)